MPAVADPPVVSAPVVPVVPTTPPAENAFTKMRGTLAGTTPEPKAVSKVEPVAPAKETPPVTSQTTPAEVKPATPAPTEAEEFLKTASTKTQERFLKLANERAEALYQEKLKTTKLLTPEVEEKLTAAEKRAADMETELRQSSIERSPEYKTKFIERPKAILTQLADFAKTWEIASTDLISAIEGGREPESRRKLNTLLSSIGDMDRADVTELAREFQKIQEDKKAVLSDFTTAQKLLDEKRFNETKTAVEKLVAMRSESLKTTVIPQMEKEYSSLFEGEDGVALKTTIVGHIEKLNGCNLETMSPGDRAAMVTCAFLAQPLMKSLAASKARVAELEAKLAMEDDIPPALGGRSNGTPPEEKPKGFFQSMREEVGSR